MTQLLTDFGHQLLGKNAKENFTGVFRNQPQLPFIIDCLSRHTCHHVGLISHLSHKIHYALLEGLAQHITEEPVPVALKQSDIIYFDTITFINQYTQSTKFTQALETLLSELKLFRRTTIFAFHHTKNPEFDWFIRQLTAYPTLRLIILAPQQQDIAQLSVEHQFSTTRLIEPNTITQINLLKAFRTELENAHQVSISDEIIAHAYAMASHYLPGHSSFDKTLMLLDSASARASAEHPTENKIAVTQPILAQVTSHWTQIPVTHLHNNKFQAAKLTDTLRKHIFGQDTAINAIASLLQNAGIKLQKNPGPLCSFLLVGSHDTGKTETAYAIAEHLLGSKDAILHINLHHPEWKMLLLNAVKNMPYAILLIEDIDKIAPEKFDFINAIIEQKYLLDEENNHCDFSHTILIATTRFASDHINHAATHTQENAKPVDLMQLVLNEHIHDPSSPHNSHLSPQEICEELLPKLAEHFPTIFLQSLNIIPFVPLDYAALEKIVRLKIRLLGRRLQSSFGLDLSFAPEVVKFLAHEALWRKTAAKSFDKLLEQHLYSAVTHEILANAENKNRSKRLLIQLNDSGELLRCEFMTPNEAALYSL